FLVPNVLSLMAYTYLILLFANKWNLISIYLGLMIYTIYELSGFIRGPGDNPKPLALSFHDKFKQGPLPFV
ncbi:hypothetical protein GBA52_024838, partial [Prunus armeniaca]